MVKVTVVFFASLRDGLGQDRLLIEANSVAALLDTLKQQLSSEHFALITAPSVRIALNHDLVEGDCLLQDGDEVAFLPPVTGG